MKLKTSAAVTGLQELARRCRTVLPSADALAQHLDGVASSSPPEGSIHPNHHNDLLPGGRLITGRFPYPVAAPNESLSFEEAQRILRKTLIEKKKVNAWCCLQEEVRIPIAGGTFYRQISTKEGDEQQQQQQQQQQQHGPFHLYHDDAARFAESNGQPLPAVLHFPIVDYGIPTVTRTLPFLASITELLAAEQHVYLHCKGGLGRTGTVAAVILDLLYPEWGPTEALQRVNEGAAARYDIFSEPEPGLRISPETEEQVSFVHEMSAVLRNEEPEEYYSQPEPE
jgi:hypothetical protein